MEVWGWDFLDLHFGDAWRGVNLALLRSVEIGTEVGFSVPTDDHLELCRQMLAELDSPGRVRVVRRARTLTLQQDGSGAVVPTKTRWCGDRGSRRVVYQFDGLYGAEQKNPPQSDQRWWFKYMTSRGWVLRSLGKHLGVHKSIQEAAAAAFFVGACSGLAQLCYSVGVPVYVVKYGVDAAGLQNWHSGRARGFPRTLYDFVQTWIPELALYRSTGCAQTCGADGRGPGLASSPASP